MSLGLRIKLSIMMFFQYYIWGIWLPLLGQQLGPNGVNMDLWLIGITYTVYGFGSILGPFIVGQLADRYFSTEKLMGTLHILGGPLLIATAYCTSFAPIFGLLFLYCNLYMATMGLSNSITFRSLGDAHQDEFPRIRVWGTLGFIAAGLSFAFYLSKAADISVLQPLFNVVGQPGLRDCLRIAGVISMFYGVYCFFLPHTPPVPVAHRSAILESLALMKHPSFRVLVIVSGLVGIMLAFYFALEAFFLEDIGVPVSQVGGYMTIGQIAEVVVMFLVPIAVERLGVKRTMLLGAGAWALRFALSMFGQPLWLMVGSIGLHGFCFGFFFVVAQMYVDRAATGDIKASAQNLLIFVIYGIGTIIGSVVAGQLLKLFRPAKPVLWSSPFIPGWSIIWAGPFVLTLLCMAGFSLFFRESEIRKPVADLQVA